MSSKLGTRQLEILKKIQLGMQVNYSVTNKRYNAYGSYVPYKSADKKVCCQLQTKGLISPYVYGYYNLTVQGWEYLNTSPVQMMLDCAIESLNYELEYKRDAKINDTPSYSEWTVKMYQDLYKNPNMTQWEVYALERDRCFQNSLLRESRIVQLEHEIARFEVILLRHKGYEEC